MLDLEQKERAREEKNRYQREWRAANKDRVKLINARYWAKRAAKAAADQEADDAGNGKNRA